MGHYRDIYFSGRKFTKGSGDELIVYDGVMYEQASKMEGFFQKYDPAKDLYIPCNACARKKYSMFMHIGTEKPAPEQKKATPKQKRQVKTVAKVSKSMPGNGMPTSEKMKARPKKRCTKC